MTHPLCQNTFFCKDITFYQILSYLSLRDACQFSLCTKKTQLIFHCVLEESAAQQQHRNSWTTPSLSEQWIYNTLVLSFDQMHSTHTPYSETKIHLARFLRTRNINFFFPPPLNRSYQDLLRANDNFHVRFIQHLHYFTEVNSPLHRNAGIKKALLDAASNNYVILIHPFLQQATQEELTREDLGQALHQAAINGCTQAFFLLAQGTEAGIRPTIKYTNLALAAALTKGQKDIVSFLLKKITVRDPCFSQTLQEALLRSAATGDKDITVLILQGTTVGDSINAESLSLALEWASANNHLGTVRLLMKGTSGLNPIYPSLETIKKARFLARQNNHRKVVEFFDTYQRSLSDTFR